MAATAPVLGIDVGGTGIKGAVVDMSTGSLISSRVRLDTPRPGTPQAVAESVGSVVKLLDFTGPIGVAFPGAISRGTVMSAANLDKSWIGQQINSVIDSSIPEPGAYLNDADAATLAEVRFGAGRDKPGLIVMVTFGTGIGVGLVYDGKLIPNCELGHIEIDGQDAETKAAASARDRDGMSWQEWAGHANRFLVTLEKLLYPDLVIFGGGITRNPEKWAPHLQLRTPVVIAQLINNAGIVGAALAAHEAGGATRSRIRTHDDLDSSA